MSSPQKTAPKWHHPSEVMKLHKLKLKKKALQARIKGDVPKDSSNSKTSTLEDIVSKKRPNPFLKCSDSKRPKPESLTILDESTDHTLFKLLHQNEVKPQNSSTLTSFENILSNNVNKEDLVIVKGQGAKHPPIDWTLKRKVRLWSTQSFLWNKKLKISEEASGTTGFVRCLDSNSTTKLDTSPNAKFHQCCLYWQHPSIPWMSLFPRSSGKISDAVVGITNKASVKSSLQSAWADSLRSLFHLIRTKQCPYFYACSNNFTVLFRAAGVCGFEDTHVLVTPTTRGFRQLLQQEEIEFSMPLKKKRASDQGYQTMSSTSGEDFQNGTDVEKEKYDEADESWLIDLGITSGDLKKINSTQARITHKAECHVDNSEQSLVLIEGVEVHAFFNFFLNCKCTTALTGPLAGIPPTLLAPVGFHGATLNSLKVHDSKVHVDNQDFFSIELTGPILPTTVQTLFGINSSGHSMSANFVNLTSTSAFSHKIKGSNQKEEVEGNLIFNKENLSDCGLSGNILEQFCASNTVTNVECLKYNSESQTYTWT